MAEIPKIPNLGQVEALAETAEKEAAAEGAKTESFGKRVSEQLAKGVLAAGQAWAQAYGAGGDLTPAAVGTVDKVLTGGEAQRSYTPSPVRDNLERIKHPRAIPAITLKATRIQTGLGVEVDQVLSKSQSEMVGNITLAYNTLKDHIIGVEQSVITIDQNVRSVNKDLQKFQKKTTSSIEDISLAIKKLTKAQSDQGVKFKDIELEKKSDATQAEGGFDLSDALVGGWIAKKGFGWLKSVLPGALGLGSLAGIAGALWWAEQQRQAAGGQGPWVEGSQFPDQRGGRRIVGGVLDWLEKPYSKEEQDRIQKERDERVRKQEELNKAGPRSTGPTGPQAGDTMGKPYGPASADWWKNRQEGRQALFPEFWADTQDFLTKKAQPTQLPKPILEFGRGKSESGIVSAGIGGADETPGRGWDWLSKTRNTQLPELKMLDEAKDIAKAAGAQVESLNIEKLEINLTAQRFISLTAQEGITIKGRSIIFDAPEIEFKGVVKGLGKGGEEAGGGAGEAAAGGGLQKLDQGRMMEELEGRQGILSHIEKTFGMTPGTLTGRRGGGGEGAAVEAAPTLTPEQEKIKQKFIETGAVSESEAKTLWGDKIPEGVTKSLVPGTAQPKMEGLTPVDLAPKPITPLEPFPATGPTPMPTMPEAAKPTAVPTVSATPAATAIPATPAAVPATPATAAIPSVPAAAPTALPGKPATAMEKLKEVTQPGATVPMQKAPPGALGPVAKPQYEYRAPVATKEQAIASLTAPKTVGGNLAQNQQAAYAAARAQGLSDKAARLLVGNMSGESLKNPSDEHWDVKHMSQGIVQWDPSRAERIKNKFGDYPKNLSVEKQTEAAIWEMKTHYSGAYEKLTNEELSDYDRMYAVVKQYESPAGPEAQAKKRLGLYSGLDVSEKVVLPAGQKPTEEQITAEQERLSKEQRSQLAAGAAGPTRERAETELAAKEPFTGETRVAELQSKAAAIRKGAIRPTLKEQLEYAATQTDVQVEVTSGGQRMAGAPGATGSHRHDVGGAADLKLYVMEDGKKRYLNMTNPEDAARMKQFTSAAVQAGATGVGAGTGYMGGETIHVGGGKAASWGGASWIEQARVAGVEAREGFDLAEWRKQQETKVAAVDLRAPEKPKETVDWLKAKTEVAATKPDVSKPSVETQPQAVVAKEVPEKPKVLGAGMGAPAVGAKEEVQKTAKPQAEKSTWERIKEGAQEAVGIKPAGAAEVEKSKATVAATEANLQAVRRKIEPKPEVAKTEPAKPAVDARAQAIRRKVEPATPVKVPVGERSLEPALSTTTPPKPAASTVKSGPGPRKQERSSTQADSFRTKETPGYSAKSNKTTSGNHSSNQDQPHGGDRSSGGGGGGTSPDHCHFCDP